MIVDRLKSLVGSKPEKTEGFALQPGPEVPATETEPDWMTTAKVTVSRYPKTFLGISLVAGVAIGWLIKRR